MVSSRPERRGDLPGDAAPVRGANGCDDGRTVLEPPGDGLASTRSPRTDRTRRGGGRAHVGSMRPRATSTRSSCPAAATPRIRRTRVSRSRSCCMGSRRGRERVPLSADGATPRAAQCSPRRDPSRRAAGSKRIGLMGFSAGGHPAGHAALGMAASPILDRCRSFPRESSSVARQPISRSSSPTLKRPT